jgi:hypothetical protein
MMTSQVHCHSTLYDFCNSTLLSIAAKRKRIFSNLKKSEVIFWWVLKNLNKDSNTILSISVYFSLPFIPLACAECDDSLPFSAASSIPLCHVLFPATLLHQLFFNPFSPHLFGLPLSLVVPKFIYNTLLGILFFSILCTCPKQQSI